MAAIGAAKYAAHAWTDRPEGGARSYRDASWRPLWDAARSAQVALARDIFGNPFRPVSFDNVWQTSSAVALAQRMYESRDFSLMPILADAMQDAGCEHPDILGHCRDDGNHVRGCWVVDLVLAKEEAQCGVWGGCVYDVEAITARPGRTPR